MIQGVILPEKMQSLLVISRQINVIFIHLIVFPKQKVTRALGGFVEVKKVR